MKRFFFLCNSLVFATFLFGQSPDSISNSPTIDSIDIASTTINSQEEKQKKGFVKRLFNFKKNYPSPKKAILLSAILPGAGQIYNKKYWKLPIVYGALGAMGYFISFNTGQYKRFKKAYTYRLDEDDTTIDEFTIVLEDDTRREVLSDLAINENRKNYQKNKELSYIGFFATYLLVGIDAFVDAHLLSFDVNDDLTLNVRPQFEMSPNSEGAVGLHFSFQPKGNSEVVLPVTF